MRFAFVMGSNFHLGSVDERALGGSESAVCHLSRALSAKGHEVTLYSFVEGPSTDPHSGAQTEPISCTHGRVRLPPSLLESRRDLVVMKNGLFEAAPVLRKHLPAETPLWLWTGHAPDQSAMAPLIQPEVVRSFSQLVFLTAWQRDQTLAAFPHTGALPSRVLRHAIAPCFAGLFSGPEGLLSAKTRAGLSIAYTSTPFRGLDVLVDIWPRVLDRHPSAQLLIHSGMELYGVPPEEDPHAALYARASALEGAERPGPMEQSALSNALRGYGVLAYPNTFPETGCIAVMEALAAGMRVVTSDLGALPETARGHARLVDPAEGFASRFAEALIEEIDLYDTGAAREARWAQVEDLNATHTWSDRAREWVEAVRSSVSLPPAQPDSPQAPATLRQPPNAPDMKEALQR